MLPTLRYTADRRSIFFVMLYFTTVALGWVFWPSVWYLQLPLVLLVCVLSFICAVITHNTVHHPIFRQRGWNKVFQVVLSFSYGHPVSAYVPGHNFSHHNNTQSAKDTIRTSKMRFRINFFNQLLFFFFMIPGIVRDEANFTKMMHQERPNWWRQYNLERVLVMGTKIGLTILNWKLGLLLLWVPHFYAAWGIVGTNYWQHDGCDADHQYNHSRNFTNKFLNYIAFNNGFHGMHHEKAGLHWSLLPEYHEKHLVPHLHPNLNRNSLVAYLFEAHVYPGKRVDYLGNAMVLGPKQKDEDWIPEVDLSRNKLQLGVEG